MHDCLQGDNCLGRQAACRVSLVSTLLTAVHATISRQIGQADERMEDHELINRFLSYKLCSCCCPCRQGFHYGLSSDKLELCWRESGAA